MSGRDALLRRLAGVPRRDGGGIAWMLSVRKDYRSRYFEPDQNINPYKE